MNTYEEFHHGSAEWLARRRKSIGGSEVAAILGASPYSGPYEVWLDKVGDHPGVDETEAMRFGTVLEQTIAQEWATREGYDLLMHPDGLQRVYSNPELPHLHYTPDQLITIDGSEAGILEIKNRSEFTAAAWDESLPFDVLVQVLQGMAVVGCRYGYAVALVGGNRLRAYRIDPHPAEWEEILSELTAFWHRVEDNIPPPLDGLESTSGVLQDMFEPDAGLAVPLTGAAESFFHQLVSVRAEMKTLEAEEARLKNEVKSYMGEATTALIDGEKVATWKAGRRKAFDASSFKEDHPDVHADYMKSTPTRSFRFTNRKTSP